MTDTKACSNCGSHRAFRVSLTKTDEGGFKQVESDRRWLELIDGHTVQASWPGIG